MIFLEERIENLELYIRVANDVTNNVICQTYTKRYVWYVQQCTKTLHNKDEIKDKK